MSKRSPEKELIDAFKIAITSDDVFGIQKEVNFGADSDTVADVEYLAKNNEYLIIEAKSHKSSNAQNTRHQIFGQLLKEHGKKSELRNDHLNKAKFGLLIPGDKAVDISGAPKDDGVTYYRNGFATIPKDKFSGFVELVNATYVFVFFSGNESVVKVYSWASFYCAGEPIRTINSNITSK